MRIKILLLFIILSACTLPPKESAYFPEDVFHHSKALSEYISTIDLSDPNTIKKEYLIILSFVNESINAYQENIEKLSTGEFYMRHPALIGGNLSFVEEKVDVYEMFDIDLQKTVLLPDYNASHDETIWLSTSVLIYNILIDFWYNKTGELLHERINYDNVIKRIQELNRIYINENN